MAEFIELHKKSLMDEKTFAVLQNVNNISEICETPRREALISLRNNPVAGYYDRFETVETYEQIKQLLSECGSIAAADVAPVVHGRCPICSGRKILTQDCDNGYSVEVDAEQGEMSIWQGATCLTVISIDYCPNCGARMDGGGSDDKR